MSDEHNFDPKKFKDDLHDEIHRQVHEQARQGRKPFVVGIHLGRRTYGGGMIWGVILTLLGLGLLLDHMGIISIDRI